MTAKEKASEIANRFVAKSVFDMSKEELKSERLRAKRNAAICVNEIINGNFGDGYDHQFWMNVKEEIANL